MYDWEEWLDRNQIRIFLLAFLALVTPTAMYFFFFTWLSFWSWGALRQQLTAKK